MEARTSAYLYGCSRTCWCVFLFSSHWCLFHTLDILAF